MQPQIRILVHLVCSLSPQLLALRNVQNTCHKVNEDNISQVTDCIHTIVFNSYSLASSPLVFQSLFKSVCTSDIPKIEMHSTV